MQPQSSTRKTKRPRTRLQEEQLRESNEKLFLDIQTCGADALRLPVRELKTKYAIGAARAERLKTWVLKYGTLDPRGHGTPPEERRKEGPTGGETWLVIGDVHVAPGQSYRRLKWAGRMARELKVDRVIQGGDWNSFDSLCSARSNLDRGQDRLRDELLATELSLAAWNDGLDGYAVPKTLIEGNHDKRPADLAREDPWMEGAFDVWKAHREDGWEVVPYLKPWRKNGILFQHYLTGRGSNRAISGMYHAKRILERVKYHESVIVFHSHRMQWWMERHSEKNVHGIVAGCFMEHYEEYAGMDNDEWWSGAILLKNVNNGDFDMETYSMDRIRVAFGDD